MKTKFSVLAILTIAFVCVAKMSTSTEKNPELTDYFTIRYGKVIVMDSFYELKATDVRIEDLATMMNEFKSQKKIVDKLAEQCDELTKQNKELMKGQIELKKEYDELKRKLSDMERKLQSR